MVGLLDAARGLRRNRVQEVMVRPLKAINLIHQKMGEMLQRREPADAESPI